MGNPDTLVPVFQFFVTWASAKGFFDQLRADDATALRKARGLVA